MAHSATYEEVGKEAVTDDTETQTLLKQDGVPVTEFLTGQILQHYQTIKTLEARLGNLFESQENCIKNLAEDNDKFIEAKRNFNFGLMYRTKVIKETQEKRLRRKREEQERQEELERLLTAKPGVGSRFCTRTDPGEHLAPSPTDIYIYIRDGVKYRNRQVS
ncbi:hypothetical protein Avbf_05922, partial [Armadillidium vulgare]